MGNFQNLELGYWVIPGDSEYVLKMLILQVSAAIE